MRSYVTLRQPREQNDLFQFTGSSVTIHQDFFVTCRSFCIGFALLFPFPALWCLPREIRILNIDHRQITVEIRGEPSKHVKDSPQMPGKIQSNPKTRGEALMSLLLQSLRLLCQSKSHQRWGAVGCVEFPSLNMQWGLFRAAFLFLWITWSYATGNKEACWGHQRVPAGQRMRGAARLGTVTWKSEKLVVLAADFTG